MLKLCNLHAALQLLYILQLMDCNNSKSTCQTSFFLHQIAEWNFEVIEANGLERTIEPYNFEVNQLIENAWVNYSNNSNCYSKESDLNVFERNENKITYKINFDQMSESLYNGRSEIAVRNIDRWVSSHRGLL